MPVVLFGDEVMEPELGLAAIGVEERDVGVIALDCWDPESGEFGAEAGISTIRIVPRVHVEAMLAALVAASKKQQESLAVNGEYLTRPSELFEDPWPIRRSDVSLVDGGWSLTAESDYFACTFDEDSDVESIAAEVLDPSSLMPDSCRLVDSVQTQTMQRVWRESGGGF